MGTAKKYVAVCWKFGSIRSQVNNTSFIYSSDLKHNLMTIHETIHYLGRDIEKEERLMPYPERAQYNSAWANKILLDISNRIDMLKKNMVIEILQRD